MSAERLTIPSMSADQIPASRGSLKNGRETVHWDEVIVVLRDPSCDRRVVKDLLCEVTRAVYKKFSKDREDHPAVFVNVSKSSLLKTYQP